MSTDPDLKSLSQASCLERIAPGPVKLLHYRRDDFSHDLIAGLSVMTVALPVVLAERGVVLAADGRQTELHHWAESHHSETQSRKVRHYPTFREAIRMYRLAQGMAEDS